jgi:hypothetical protein
LCRATFIFAAAQVLYRRGAGVKFAPRTFGRQKIIGLKKANWIKIFRQWKRSHNP